MSESKKQYVLGLDTSNYTSSVALIDSDWNIVVDKRIPIKVEEGMKGIRQSEALFQHLDNVPMLLEDILRKYGHSIKAVCASAKPRPIEGSYMPVFKAGLNYGQVAANSLNIPFYETSHQEGHIEAGKYGVLPNFTEEIAVYHLSGGTTEILLKNQIIGGTKDISFGQLIDRLGVAAGFPFPAGAKLDEIACSFDRKGSYFNMEFSEFKKSNNINKKIDPQIKNQFKPIATDELEINLSGLDSQLKRIIEKEPSDEVIQQTVVAVFNLITQCLITLTKRVKKQYNISCVLFVGGVSSSKYIRDALTEEFTDLGVQVCFARQDLASDNAVGTALIGGKRLWH